MRYSFVKLLLLLLLCLHASQLLSQVDSLKKALPLAKEDTAKLAILSELCFEYANNAPDSAMVYFEQQKALADRVNIPKYTANAFNDLAVIQYYQSNYSDALINNKKALEIRQGLGDKSLIVSSLNKIAIIYQELGNYEQATIYQLQVLKLAEELKNEKFITITLNNISLLYQKVKKYDQAFLYTRRSLALAMAANDTYQMALSYTGLESLYESKRDIDSAIICQKQAIKYFQQVNAQSELSAVYNDLGLLYRDKGRDDLSRYYYRQALDIAVKMDSKNDEAFYAANLGSVYMDSRKPDSGFVFINMAKAIGEDIKPTVWKTIYASLERYYIFKNQHDSAIYYNDLYRNITESIYSATLSSQVTELLTKYETEKKEHQIALLDEQNKIKQLTIDRKNIVIGSIAGFFIMVAILSILFYNRYRMKQEAILHQEILRQQQMASKAVIAAEELERQRIARDLHDGIGQMFSAVKMNLSGLADRVHIPEEAEKVLLDKTLKLVDDSCKEVRAISHQMMPNILLKMGLSMAIRDFIDKIDESKLKVTLETFGLKQSLESNVETVLYRVIQESVNNVIKHARATTLDIQLHRDDESITVMIEDNGTGFNAAAIPDGIGLKSIKARVAFLNGKVDYDSAPGRGTLVAIYIPYKNA